MLTTLLLSSKPLLSVSRSCPIFVSLACTAYLYPTAYSINSRVRMVSTLYLN
jgi:hypothetical protein